MELSSKDLLSSVKKGFLIWSWLGLLAAYVSTSSVFSSQLYIIVTQGARGFKLTQYEYVGLGILFFPPIILAMGWFVFYRYSVFLLRETIAPLMDIEPDDEIISRNYENLSSIIREREEIKHLYEHALTYLPNENEFVLQKLQSFFLSAKKDRDFNEDRMPIPRWKFKVMMGTDQQKALSLLEQWLNKGYIRKTGDRGNYNELIYELNPLILKRLSKLKPKKINPSWLKGIEQLNADTLEDLGYFTSRRRVERVKKSIRNILLRDLDEMFLNYVMGNEKAVIILSGSIVEFLLIYFCEKKKTKSISYQRHNKTISKKLYECDLGDLLTYFEQNRLLGDVVIHMGNISRIYRNFVHPGKELREQAVLDQAKANLCFVSTIEILNRVCT